MILDVDTPPSKSPLLFRLLALSMLRAFSSLCLPFPVGGSTISLILKFVVRVGIPRPHRHVGDALFSHGRFDSKTVDLLAEPEE